MLNENDVNQLKQYAKQTRQNIVKMVYNAQSGHIGGSLSAADIMTVLYHKVMNICPDWKDSKDFEKRDRFVLSKGHASAVYYAVLAQLGFIKEDDLTTFRLYGSMLQGHPNTHCPGVEVATGSLGQGLSMACGIAMALKLDKNPSKVYVLMGDGELQEGSVWEGFMHASHRGLNNLIAIIDKNGLQIDGCTDSVKSLGSIENKIKAFDWDVIEIDGHDIEQIYNAFMKAQQASKPTAIVANTVKGKGVSFMENNAGWHGTAPNKEQFESAMAELK